MTVGEKPNQNFSESQVQMKIKRKLWPNKSKMIQSDRAF